MPQGTKVLGEYVVSFNNRALRITNADMSLQHCSYPDIGMGFNYITDVQLSGSGHIIVSGEMTDGREGAYSIRTHTNGGQTQWNAHTAPVSI